MNSPTPTAEVNAMHRPWLLRVLPDRLKLSAWARLYQSPGARWRSLYQHAPLRYAPQAVMELVPGDLISSCLAFTGLYELSLTRRLVHLARQGGTMIDVGANLGYFSLLWAMTNPANRCHAFEASPRIIEILQRNLARNRVEDRVRLIPKAAGKEPGTLGFDVGPPEQTGWGGLTAATAGGAITVEVVRVDEQVSEPGDIALLKIDVEGADTWALMGCERLLRQRRVKEVWYEQNKPRMRALGIGEREAEEYLRSVGYEARLLGDTSAETVDWTARPA
jgi:FkbM family methyltransferase